MWSVTRRARSQSRPNPADGPSADMPYDSNFVKVLMLRDVELGGNG